ncbi:MAG: ParB N-terminal domain-containing protein [Schwartzia sp.]|nr:ParB N-terminal domain-containing protein [Schwartzia sp. (in: firmicutes)]
MNIREISTSRLHEYENNPRNNDLAVEKVKYSIERFGFLFPIVVDMNFVIVCGHTRVRACRELGIQSVPCIIADELSEEQINLFRLIDNKTSEYSDWDFEKLKDELSTVDLTLDKNQLLLERFELTAEVFDIEPEQAEIKIPAFNFMGVDDDKPKEKKPPVSTIYSNGLVDGEPEDVEIVGEIPEIVQEESGGSELSAPEEKHESSESGDPQQENGDSEEAVTDKPKKSKAVLPFCQFRFGDVAFFISQVELDRMNDKYAEYIDSGAALECSFVDYLLKGVETGD